jgi:hypothetical protein
MEKNQKIIVLSVFVCWYQLRHGHHQLHTNTTNYRIGSDNTKI